ncbi:hypothetical protein DV515_00011434 [Chloebia gouldiae]|uniref:Uncharacterized protein n=1 Tax=Chloebia gouldiae TaxID=44316 RepID=A0A3L8S7K7_CHLGU|nr:hypothetical protein DV515_00011434 [Chloebia gouldiae]
MCATPLPTSVHKRPCAGMCFSCCQGTPLPSSTSRAHCRFCGQQQPGQMEAGDANTATVLGEAAEAQAEGGDALLRQELALLLQVCGEALRKLSCLLSTRVSLLPAVPLRGWGDGSFEGTARSTLRIHQQFLASRLSRIHLGTAPAGHPITRTKLCSTLGSINDCLILKYNRKQGTIVQQALPCASSLPQQPCAPCKALLRKLSPLSTEEGQGG